MKMNTTRSYLCGLGGLLLMGQVLAAPAGDNQQVGYALGYLSGQGNATEVKDLDVDQFVKGFREGYTGQKPSMSEDQMKMVLTKFRDRLILAQQQKLNAEAKKNLADGAAYLAANSKKPGVHVTASGLQYSVEKAGSGAHPKATDVVRVQYEGRLISGKVFDSSYARHQPAEFPLNQVIPGWTEGLQLMQVGSVYDFVIPAKLAYGEAGSSGVIPPDAVLLFKVELLAINPAK